MKYISVKDATKMFSVSYQTIHDWLKKGTLEEGPKQGTRKTILESSCNKLIQDSFFMQGIKRSEKEKQDNDNISNRDKTESENNSQLQELLNQILEKQDEILRNQELLFSEIADIKREKKADKKAGKQVEKKPIAINKPKPEKKATPPKKELPIKIGNDFFEEAKAYINETINMGHTKVQINPSSFGAGVGVWLDGEVPNPPQETVQKWYGRAKELREGS